jgi:deazaflavin-dependent oxidoreductase (nitroreductase family)
MNLKSTAFQQVVRLHVPAYRLSRGLVGGRVGKARVLLLHHIGRRSGKERVSPLLYLPDGEDVVIVASKGGSHSHPLWWLNLREMPATTVEIGAERRRVKVREANEAERARLWPRLVEIWPDYASYQKRTERQIPLGILSPA